MSFRHHPEAALSDGYHSSRRDDEPVQFLVSAAEYKVALKQKVDAHRAESKKMREKLDKQKQIEALQTEEMRRAEQLGMSNVYAAKGLVGTREDLEATIERLDREARIAEFAIEHIEWEEVYLTAQQLRTLLDPTVGVY